MSNETGAQSGNPPAKAGGGVKSPLGRQRNGESPRPDPGFRVYVQRGQVVADVTHAVQDVYDIAVGSMDFGSGFLSTEEVGNLRTLGRAIGAQHFDYQKDRCLRCGHEHGDHYTTREGCALACDCGAFVSPEPVETTTP